MIQILYTNISKCFITKAWEYYLEDLPPDIKESVLKYQKQNDRLRVLCGKLLLQKLLLEINQEALFNTIQLDQYKRPFVSNEIDFNISHSGDYVICGLSAILSKTCPQLVSGRERIEKHSIETLTTNKIGIDIEKKRNVNYEEFERVFTETEMQKIKSSQNPIDTFFQFWTMKEAIMKADGRGFHLPPNTFTVQNNSAIINEKNWYLKRLTIDENYDCHLATENAKIEIEINDIIFY